jgi:rubredoxin
MSDEFHYTFKCPKCGCPTFEEILINVTQSTTFERVNCDAEITEPDYQNTSTEGGEINRFQCQSCGFVLQNEHGDTINDTQVLKQWLEKNGQKTADESSG